MGVQDRCWLWPWFTYVWDGLMPLCSHHAVCGIVVKNCKWWHQPDSNSPQWHHGLWLAMMSEHYTVGNGYNSHPWHHNASLHTWQVCVCLHITLWVHTHDGYMYVYTSRCKSVCMMGTCTSPHRPMELTLMVLSAWKTGETFDGKSDVHNLTMHTAESTRDCTVDSRWKWSTINFKILNIF